MHAGFEVGQALPQLPQFMGSFAMVVQVPPQSVSPIAGQGSTQLPWLQAKAEAGQACAQRPQFMGSMVVSMHMPPQSDLPMAGQGSKHCDPAQANAVGGQAIPHDPQFAESEVRSTQLPAHSVLPSERHMSGWTQLFPARSQIWPVGHGWAPSQPGTHRSPVAAVQYEPGSQVTLHPLPGIGMQACVKSSQRLPLGHG
jgi:hypothetical protein